jgi:folate-binding protein YgfZ
MIADIEVLRRDSSIVGLVAPGTAAALAARFDQLIFSEDLRVVDTSAESFELRVIGAQAHQLIAAALGASAEMLLSLPESWHVDASAGTFIVRGGGAPQSVFRIIGPVAQRDEVIATLEAAGVEAIDSDLVDAMRIMSGRPAWGHDLADDVIPLEAGLLERAISTSKGCYVGQEIVIRMLHRGGGRVAKRLVTLELAADATDLPASGTALKTGAGADTGRLTSVAVSP